MPCMRFIYHRNIDGEYGFWGYILMVNKIMLILITKNRNLNR